MTIHIPGRGGGGDASAKGSRPFVLLDAENNLAQQVTLGGIALSNGLWMDTPVGVSGRVDVTASIASTSIMTPEIVYWKYEPVLEFIFTLSGLIENQEILMGTHSAGNYQSNWSGNYNHNNFSLFYTGAANFEFLSKKQGGAATRRVNTDHKPQAEKPYLFRVEADAERMVKMSLLDALTNELIAETVAPEAQKPDIVPTYSNESLAGLLWRLAYRQDRVGTIPAAPSRASIAFRRWSCSTVK